MIEQCHRQKFILDQWFLDLVCFFPKKRSVQSSQLYRCPGSVMADTSEVAGETRRKLLGFFRMPVKTVSGVRGLFPGDEAGGSDSWFVCQNVAFPNKVVLGHWPQTDISTNGQIRNLPPSMPSPWGSEASKCTFPPAIVCSGPTERELLVFLPGWDWMQPFTPHLVQWDTEAWSHPQWMGSHSKGCLLN